MCDRSFSPDTQASAAALAFAKLVTQAGRTLATGQTGILIKAPRSYGSSRRLASSSAACRFFVAITALIQAITIS